MITRQKTGYRQPGMAMAEYVLIGTLVLLVCIAGFMGVGNNLRDWFVSMQGDMNQQVQQTQATQLAVAQAKTGQAEKEQALGTAEAWHVNPNDPNSLCNSEFCISAPGLTGTVVSTVGANGNTNVTHSAADVFRQIATIMKDNGADSKDLDLLTNMANQGHQLGDWQSNLATKPDYTNFKNDVDGIQSGRSNFEEMAKQLNASMGNYPPEVRAVLNDAANVIIAEGEAYTFPTYASGNIGYNLAPAVVQLSSTNSKTTHTNSNTICSNGGDQAKCMR